MYYHISPQSSNAKTGPLVVTTTSAETCPEACPLKLTCYAKKSFLGIFWRKVSAGKHGEKFADFLRSLAQALAKNPAPVWRHNQAGDLPGKGDRIDRGKLMALASVSAASGKQGFTYTHKPVRPEDCATGSAAQRKRLALANLSAVQSAFAVGFTINLSANNLAHADSLRALGLPVCVTVPQSTPETFYTPAGAKGIVCPAQTRSGVSCATCRLCSNQRRNVLIGFRFHGAGAAHGAKETGAIYQRYELPGYLLTQAQGVALERLAERFKTTPQALLSGAAPEMGNPATACLMVSIPSANLWLGIERDGYTHS